MELFVFIVFQLLMEVQSNKSPTVHVSPAVFTESRSVKISCETPADVTVKKCDFTINSKKLETKVSPPCELNLTGVEALRRADEKSPQSVNITCCYTIKGRRGTKSSDSVPVTVTVLDKLQKPLINVTEDEDQLSIVCEIPLSVRADFTCSFYYEDDAILVNRDSQWSSSGEKHLCTFNPSLSDLFRRSATSRQMSCDYSLKSEPDIRSPRSDTHIIRGLPQSRLSASASVLQETDTVELSCENTEELKMEMCVFHINGRESNSKQSSSCQLSLTASQISVWSEDQSSSVNITCFYTAKKGLINVPSPHSDPVTVTVQISSSTTALVTMTMEITASTLPSTSETTQLYSTVADLYSTTNLSTSRTNQTTCKDSTTNLPTSTAMQTTTDSTIHASTDQPTTTKHTENNYMTTLLISTAKETTDTWVKVLAFSCAGVILSVFICLSWFASKKRIKHNNMKSVKTDVSSQGNGMSCSGSPEIYSLITSVPATFQPTSDDLEHPESHLQNTADPTDTFTFHQPSDVSVHKQQQGNTEENESVYHLYCTIPDKPVQPYTGDQVYSLIQMH